MQAPLVAIVGTPNVGKSTLFNRLVGGRRAIVTDRPGVTRDRLYGEVRGDSRTFRVVDTGGMTLGAAAPFAREIERQAAAALDEAALILFVVDVRADLTALEIELASLLRKRRVPLLLVANKVDAETVEPLVHDLHRLGLGPAIPVSAEHGRGLGELVERIEQCLARAAAPGDPEEATSDEGVRVAIVGRPNVGKSSLLNRLVGEERVLVSEIPGTTRDAVDTALVLEGRRYVLIDTAGIRRRGKLQEDAERLAVDHARRSIDRCDVAVLVFDATEELAAQDAHIAGYVLEATKPLIVAVNKWDRVEQREAAAREWAERVGRRLRFARAVPLLFVSARTGQRVSQVLLRADELYAAAGRRVSTPELNRWVDSLGGRTGSAPAASHGFKLLYATQTGVRPPRFVLFCNDPRRIHFSVRRHLENSLREAFGLAAVPIRLELRSRRGD